MNMNISNIDNINIGLVLSGGGAKGAYEAGVFKAIWELDLGRYVSVISGTSIGTVNGLLFSMNDKNIVKASWSNVSYSRFILNEELTRNTTIKEALKRKKETIESYIMKQDDIALMSQRGVKEFIQEYVDINVIKNSSIDLYACSYNTSLEQPEYFKLNNYNEEEIIDITLASCAIPYIFKPININGCKYADGGINSPKYSNKNADNVPIKPLLEYDCNIIIVIYLSYKDKIDKSKFKDRTIIEIYPSQNLETIQGAGTINLRHATLIDRVELGYRDGIFALAPIVISLLKGESIDKLVEKINQSNKRILEKYKINVE